jgi:hypothetical protein
MERVMNKKIAVIGAVLAVVAGAAVFIGVHILQSGIHRQETFENGTILIGFKESIKTVMNPYKGFAPDCTNEDLCKEASLVYLELLWSELEPEEGDYRWDEIDRKYDLTRWKSEGKNLVLRFVCDLPTEEEHMDIPKWLYDRTGDGQFYDIEYGRGYCPDYNNEVFIWEHAKVIAEIGRHFEKDGFLRYVELGSLGHWGEWHTYYEANLPRIPQQDIRKKYVAPYIEAFPYAMLLMRRPFSELPEGAGVFNDMTGHPKDTTEWLDWIDEGGEYDEPAEAEELKAAPEIWKKAPVGGEFTSSISMRHLLGLRLSKTLKMVRDSHMTFIGPKIPDPDEDGDITRAAQKVLKNLGYRYRVSELTMSTQYSSDETMLSLTITNDGTAPIYFDHRMCMYIDLPEAADKESFLYLCDRYGKEGTECDGMLRFEIPVDLMEIGEGATYNYEVILPKELLEYSGVTIYIGIEDASDDVPRVKLDMDQPRRGNLTVLWESRE